MGCRFGRVWVSAFHSAMTIGNREFGNWIGLSSIEFN
jgi:hypothetical protein